MKKTRITDYHPDVDNPNQGTDRGAAAPLLSSTLYSTWARHAVPSGQVTIDGKE